MQGIYKFNLHAYNDNCLNAKTTASWVYLRDLPRFYVVPRFLVLLKTPVVNQLCSPYGTRMIMYTE